MQQHLIATATAADPAARERVQTQHTELEEGDTVVCVTTTCPCNLGGSLQPQYKRPPDYHANVLTDYDSCHMHSQIHMLWLTEQTQWGCISVFRECACQAWLACQSPAVHHTLPCCASKRH